MKIAFIVLIVLILLLFYPIKIKANAGFNFLENLGYIGLKVGIIRILLTDFYFWLNKIIFIKNDKELFSSPLIGIGQGGKFGEIFVYTILTHLKLKSFKLFAKLGYVNNAAFTSLGCNFVNIAFGLITAKVLYHKPTTKTLSAVFPSFCANECALAGNMDLNISIYILLKCLVITILKCIKGVKKNGKRVAS